MPGIERDFAGKKHKVLPFAWNNYGCLATNRTISVPRAKSPEECATYCGILTTCHYSGYSWSSGCWLYDRCTVDHGRYGIHLEWYVFAKVEKDKKTKKQLDWADNIIGKEHYKNTMGKMPKVIRENWDGGLYVAYYDQDGRPITEADYESIYQRVSPVVQEAVKEEIEEAKRYDHLFHEFEYEL